MKPYYAALLIPPLIIAIKKFYNKRRKRTTTIERLGETYEHEEHVSNTKDRKRN